MARRRAAPGFGPKGLFFDVVVPHFAGDENRRRLALACLGSACEQWINGELFQAVASMRPRIWPRPERSTADLMLFEDEQADGLNEPALVLESKVLYASEAPAHQRAKFTKLAAQLCDAEADFPSAVAVGLTVSVTWLWRDRPEGGWTVPRHGAKFRLVPRREHPALGLANAFGHSGATRITKTLECFRLGRREYAVRVAMELVPAHPRSRPPPVSDELSPPDRARCRAGLSSPRSSMRAEEAMTRCSRTRRSSSGRWSSA